MYLLSFQILENYMMIPMWYDYVVLHIILNRISECIPNVTVYFVNIGNVLFISCEPFKLTCWWTLTTYSLPLTTPKYFLYLNTLDIYFPHILKFASYFKMINKSSGNFTFGFLVKVQVCWYCCTYYLMTEKINYCG